MKKSKYLVLAALAGLTLGGCTGDNPQPGPGPDPVVITAIELDKSSATLEIGDTLQLTATVTPADADKSTLKWASSVIGVATVNAEGLVTAKGAGDAVITVSAGDVKATCSVHVNEKVLTDWTDAQKAAMQEELGIEIPFIPGVDSGTEVYIEDGEFDVTLSFETEEEASKLIEDYAELMDEEIWYADVDGYGDPIYYAESANTYRFEDGTVDYPMDVTYNTYAQEGEEGGYEVEFYAYSQMVGLPYDVFPGDFVEDIHGYQPKAFAAYTYLVAGSKLADEEGNVYDAVNVVCAPAQGQELDVEGYLQQLALEHYALEEDEFYEAYYGVKYFYECISWDTEIDFILYGDESSILLVYYPTMVTVFSYETLAEAFGECLEVSEGLEEHVIIPTTYQEPAYKVLVDIDEDLVPTFKFVVNGTEEDFLVAFAGMLTGAGYEVGEPAEDGSFEAVYAINEESNIKYAVAAADGVATLTVTVKEAEVKSSIEDAYEEAITLNDKVESSQTYTMKGVVTGISGNTFFFQDGAYGMQVYNVIGKDYVTGEVKVGYEVTVVATVQSYNGVVETKNVTSVAVGEAKALPKALKVSSLEELNAARQNVLVTFDWAPNADVTGYASNKSVNPKGNFYNGTVVGDELIINFNKFGHNDEYGAVVNGLKGGTIYKVTGAITTFFQNSYTGKAGLANQVTAPSTTTFVAQAA